MNHVITFDQLKKGDHIYRQLSIWGIDACFFQHHGIVSHVPPINPNHANILVLEMTKFDDFAGIQEVTLDEFLDGRKLRIVKYNVSYFYQQTHLSGTCHTEPKSDPLVILERCNQIQKIFEDVNDTYSLFGINCEHFALFCVTGMVDSGIKNTQILSLLRKADGAAHCAQTLAHTAHTAHAHTAHTHTAHTHTAHTHTAHAHIAHAHTAHAHLISSVPVTAGISSVPVTAGYAHLISSVPVTSGISSVPVTAGHATASTTLAANAANVVSSNVSTTAVAHVKSFFQPISAGTVGIFVGVAAGLQTIVSVYEYWKYKNDVTYFKEDLIRDLIKGWTNTTLIIGVGILGMAMGFGWWVILPLFGVSFLLHWLFKKYYKDTEYKEKCYNARGLTLDSSRKEKKTEIRRIKQEIKKEKLHPNHWKRDIENRILGDIPEDVTGIQKIIAWWKKWRVKKEKQKRSKKFLWLMSVKELLEHDINNEWDKLLDDLVDEVLNGCQLAITLEQDGTSKSI